MFRNNDETKRMEYDMNTHKTMKIPDGMFQNNNTLFDIVNPRNASKL